MNYEQEYQELITYSNTLKGSQFIYKDEWEVHRFMLLDKMYGMIGYQDNGDLYLTLKGLPEENELLIKTFSFIIPGHYMNKVHWYTIILNKSTLTMLELERLLKVSYQLIYNNLPKNKRKSI